VGTALPWAVNRGTGITKRGEGGRERAVRRRKKRGRVTVKKVSQVAASKREGRLLKSRGGNGAGQSKGKRKKKRTAKER